MLVSEATMNGKQTKNDTEMLSEMILKKTQLIPFELYHNLCKSIFISVLTRKWFNPRSFWSVCLLAGLWTSFHHHLSFDWWQQFKTNSSFKNSSHYFTIIYFFLLFLCLSLFHFSLHFTSLPSLSLFLPSFLPPPLTFLPSSPTHPHPPLSWRHWKRRWSRGRPWRMSWQQK